MKLVYFLLAFAIIAAADRIYFQFIVKPFAYHYFRETSEKRYIFAIAEFNARDGVGEYRLPIPKKIIDAEEWYLDAVGVLRQRAPSRRAVGFPSNQSRQVDCFSVIYCTQSWVRLKSDGSGLMQILGLRPILHTSRLLAPRTENLDGLMVGKTYDFAEFNTSEETKWLYQEAM